MHAEVQGALVERGGHVVWLTGDVPDLPADMAVDVEERVVAAADFTITGLEQDQEIFVAEDLLVRPPWVARPAGFDGMELIVPRGGAFGSGEHASTQAALLCLHRGWRSVQSFADVGCGSGILALYARVRGVARIEACDVDGPSVAATRALLPGARVEHGNASRLGRCGQVVANMTGRELAASMDSILALWGREGPLVLSGMSGSEVDAIARSVPAPEQDRLSVGRYTAVAFSPTGCESAPPVR